MTREGDAGFTLIETLVALALAAAVALLMLTTLNGSSRVFDRVIGRSAATGEVSAVQALIRRRLEDAYPGVVVDQGQGHATFEGRSGAVSVTALLPEGGSGGHQRLLLTVEGDAQRDLVLRWRPERGIATADGGSRGGQRVLLEGIADLQIRYFGRTREDQTKSWHADWIDQRDLPEIVQLQVGFPRGDRRQWPAMLIATRASADANCDFDLMVRDCRGR